MTRQEAIEILRKHNIWRRYDGPIGEGPEMVDPKKLGDAIDVVCDSEPRWRPITQRPNCDYMMEVLMARFRGNKLETIEHGFFYADDGDGYNDAYFAPSRAKDSPTGCHTMSTGSSCDNCRRNEPEKEGNGR